MHNGFNYSKSSENEKIEQICSICLCWPYCILACIVQQGQRQGSGKGRKRAELTLTVVSGEAVEAHGDHFHGLADGVEGESTVIKFDENGIATSNGHLHIEVGAV